MQVCPCLQGKNLAENKVSLSIERKVNNVKGPYYTLWQIIIIKTTFGKYITVSSHVGARLFHARRKPINYNT